MWQIAVNGQVLGVMSREQVAQSVQSGHVGANAYVSGGNLPDWTPIGQVPELAPLVANDVVPAAPPANVNATPQPQHAEPQRPVPATQPQAGAAAYANVGAAAVAQPAGDAAVAEVSGNKPSEESGDWVKERINGLKSLGLGVLLLVVNFATIWFLESFYPVTVIFAMGSFGYGGWVMVFGDEYHDQTMELVMWKRIGMWTCGVIGALLGLVLTGFIIE